MGGGGWGEGAKGSSVGVMRWSTQPGAQPGRQAAVASHSLQGSRSGTTRT